MEQITPDILVVQKLLTYHVQILGLASARWYGFFFIFPLIVWAQIPPLAISIWGFVFALPLMPGLSDSLYQSNLSIWPVTSAEVANELLSVLEQKQGTLIVIKEFLLGVMIGFFPSIFFFGLVTVGELIDQSRGDIGGKTGSGGGGLEMTDAGKILFITGSALFLASGEFLSVLRLFMTSYEVWPMFELTNFLTPDKIYYYLELSMKMLFTMSYMAIPFVVMMWSFDIQSAFQGRMDKKFQAQEYQFALKNFTFLAFMILYLNISDTAQYNPTMSIVTNFAVIMEAGGHAPIGGTDVR